MGAETIVFTGRGLPPWLLAMLVVTAPTQVIDPPRELVDRDGKAVEMTDGIALREALLRPGLASAGYSVPQERASARERVRSGGQYPPTTA